MEAEQIECYLVDDQSYRQNNSQPPQEIYRHHDIAFVILGDSYIRTVKK